MAEIFDLIAKIGWDANMEDLNKVSSAMKGQDKILDELRAKGRRLEDQMLKTNDPKKLERYNAELQNTRKQADAITAAQRTQLQVTKDLKAKQAELIKELQKTGNTATDMKKLLGSLRQVENQMDSMTKKTSNMGSKFAGLGKSILGGVGLGAGMFGAQAITSGSMAFLSDSIDEILQAEKAAAGLQLALKGTGNQRYFDGLKKEADELSKAYYSLYDNDDIISAQEALVKYGNMTRKELSEVTKVAVEMASEMRISVPEATQKIIEILGGRGAATLRDYGLSLKGVTTDAGRMSLVTNELAAAVSGASEVYSKSAEGIMKKNDVLLANVKENIGEKLLPIYIDALTLVNQTLDGEWDKIAVSFAKGLNGIAKYTSVTAYSMELLKDAFGFNDPDVKEGVSDDVRKFYGDALKKGRKQASEDAKKDPNAKLNKSAFELEEKEEKKVQDKRLDQAKKAYTDYINAKKSVDSELQKNSMSAMDFELTQLNAHFEDIKKVYKTAGKSVVDLVELQEIKKQQIKDKYAEEAYKKEVALEIERRKKRKEEAQKEANLTGEFLPGTSGDIDISGMSAGAFNEEGRKKEAQEKAKKRKESKEDNREYRQELYDNTQELAYSINSALELEKRKTDGLIALQEKRVDAARNNSEASLKIEQDRLDALVAKREKYEKRQRIIDASVIVANQAVAISGAVKSIAGSGGNPLLIAANAVAIVAGLLAVTTAVRGALSSTGSFEEGGFTGVGGSSQQSTKLGHRPYTYHKGEFVMDSELTEKHREFFEGIHNRDLVVNKLDDGKYYVTNDTASMVRDHESLNISPLIYEIQLTNKLLKQREVSVNNNFDADGFGQSVAVQMGRANLKQKRRSW